MGDSPKWVKSRTRRKREKERKRERKKERAKVGDNNGQATHGARKHAWRTQAAWANFFLFCEQSFQRDAEEVPKNTNVLNTNFNEASAFKF